MKIFKAFIQQPAGQCHLFGSAFAGLAVIAVHFDAQLVHKLRQALANTNQSAQSVSVGQRRDWPRHTYARMPAAVQKAFDCAKQTGDASSFVKLKKTQTLFSLSSFFFFNLNL